MSGFSGQSRLNSSRICAPARLWLRPSTLLVRPTSATAPGKPPCVAYGPFSPVAVAPEAEVAGWPPSELYRVPEVWARVDQCGAALLIGDSEVIEVTAARIQIRTTGGALQSFYPAPAIDYALIYKSRLKQITGNYPAGSEEPRLRAIEWAVAEHRRNTGADPETSKAVVQAAIATTKGGPR